jgi:hypothetical protein
VHHSTQKENTVHNHVIGNIVHNIDDNKVNLIFIQPLKDGDKKKKRIKRNIGHKVVFN